MPRSYQPERSIWKQFSGTPEPAAIQLRRLEDLVQGYIQIKKNPITT